MSGNFDIFLSKFQEIAADYQSTRNKETTTTNNNNKQNNDTKSEDTAGSQLSEALDEQSIKTAVKRICQLGIQQSSKTLMDNKFYETLSSVLIPNNNSNNEPYLLIDIGWDLLTELFLLYGKDERFSSFLYEICHFCSPRELCIMFSEVFTHPMLSQNAISQHFEQLNSSGNVGSVAGSGTSLMNGKKVIDDSPNISMPDDLISADTHSHSHSGIFGKMPMPLMNSNNHAGAGGLNNMSMLDIMEMHKTINYSKLQSVFVRCVETICKQLFESLEKKDAEIKNVLSKMDHYYSNLLPTTMNHFELLSKELSYHLFRKQQKLLENEQHNSVDNPHSHSRSSSSLNLQNNFIEIAKTNEKLRDEIRTSMSEYLLCVKEVSSLFSLLVSQFLKQNENNKNDSIDFIELFHSTRTDNLDIDTMSDISTDNESELRSQTGDSTGDDANDNSNSNNNADATGKNDGNNTNNEETRVRKLINKQRLWLIRFGLRIMSGLYWWHSVEYIPLNGDVKNDKNESKEKENNANTNNINRRKITPKETFFVKCLNPIIADVMLKGLEQIGLNVETLLNLQNHVKSMERKLEKFQPWSLHTPRSDEDPNSPLIRPKLAASHSHPPELTTIVEAEDAQDEEEDDANEAINNNNNPIFEDEEMPALNIDIDGGKEKKENGDNAHVSHISGNKNNIDDVDGWNDIVIDTQTPTKQQRKKEKRVQMIVDELQRWNEFVHIRGISCYLASEFLKKKENDENKENKENKQDAEKEMKNLVKNNMEILWSVVKVLTQQPATIVPGIDFGENLLNYSVGKIEDLKLTCKEDLNKLFNAMQFQTLGLWQLVQLLTSMMGMNGDPILHRKIWKFINHLINASDLQTRFQCIASTAVKCPIPVVSSLMFTELKNQMFLTWNIDFSEKNDNSETGKNSDNGSENSCNSNNSPIVDNSPLPSSVGALGRSLSSGPLSSIMVSDSENNGNPFVSRQVVMVLAQRIMKDANNNTLNLGDIYSELDSLNACLNVIRFLLLKDKETNRTNIFDDDCPLRLLLSKLNDKLSKLIKELNIEINANNQSNPINNNTAAMKNFENMQKEMMKTQMLLSMDLLKRILESYTQPRPNVVPPKPKIEKA